LSDYDKLIELSKPLRDYLGKYYGLMSVAVVGTNSIEILTAEIGIPNIAGHEEEGDCEL
jgi:hypothetical protein